MYLGALATCAVVKPERPFTQVIFSLLQSYRIFGWVGFFECVGTFDEFFLTPNTISQAGHHCCGDGSFWPFGITPGPGPAVVSMAHPDRDLALMIAQGRLYTCLTQMT